MVKRTIKSFLAGAALFGGLAFGGFASAGDGCTPCGTCTDCSACEQIFAEAGQSLTDQLASMSCGCGSYVDPGCCAPVACDVADPCVDLGCADFGCGEGCGEGGCGDGLSLFGEDSGITVGGWIQMGYHNNVTPLSTVRNQGLAFNDHPNRFNLHQGWVYVEKVADGSEGLDYGFRADLMYGVDAAQTQSFGNNAGRWDFGNGWDNGAGYGWALPQLYAEIAAGDISVKAGHFYTLIGYEVVTAPDNFFYSHALTMFNSEPFTHTGVLATIGVSDNTTVYAGWTTGWDTGFDRLNKGSSFLGGFSTAVGEKATFTYITTAGEFGWRGNGYSHSLLLDVAVTEKLNYVIQSDLVRTNLGGGDDDLGINQYLIYSVSDTLGVGTRMEWWKDEGVSYYEATFGVNVKPTDNLVIRPEIRQDWSPGNNWDETTFGVDAILTF